MNAAAKNKTLNIEQGNALQAWCTLIVITKDSTYLYWNNNG